jgi:spore coat protein U-like protein
MAFGSYSGSATTPTATLTVTCTNSTLYTVALNPASRRVQQSPS